MIDYLYKLDYSDGFRCQDLNSEVLLKNPLQATILLTILPITSLSNLLKMTPLIVNA